MKPTCDIFISAGEASGDLIGSLLVRQLLKLRPGLKVACNGGPQMRDAGAELRVDMVADLAVVGVVEVVSKLGKIKRVFSATTAFLAETRPEVVVLIDYPGFNLRLAKAAKRMGLRVVYYVPPQVWAWHKSRVHAIRELCERVFVILPFEEKVHREAGVNVRHVGHPLLDVMILTMSRDEVLRKFEFDPTKKLIGLLPGSRKREVDSLLPIMLRAAELIQAKDPAVQFVIPRASTIPRERLDKYIAASTVQVRVVDSFRYNVRSVMDFAIVASGTATLETGLLLCPMVILYRVSWLTWMIGRLIVDIPYIGLINIIAEKGVVPELLQGRCTPEAVAQSSLDIIESPAETARIRAELGRVKEKMGGPGASRRVAEELVEMIESA